MLINWNNNEIYFHFQKKNTYVHALKIEKKTENEEKIPRIIYITPIYST